jgi:hypothetical protein
VALAVVVWFVATPSVAAAQNGEQIVGVLHVEVEGVSETAAELFEDSLEEGLDGSDYTVAKRERLLSLIGNSSYKEGCYFGPCLVEIYKITRVKLVLVATIKGTGSAYSFLVSLLDTESGLVTAQVGDVCAPCTLGEAIDSASLAVVELVNVDAAAVDPDAGNTGALMTIADVRAAKEEVEARAKARSRSLSRSALFFFSAGLVAGAAGAFLINDDQKEAGYAAAAGAGASILAAGTFFVLSRRF